MRLSDLQNKDIISVNDGKKIGNIIDVNIDLNGQMSSLVVEKSKFFNSFLNGKSEIEIAWSQIQKIGEDVILVKVNL